MSAPSSSRWSAFSVRPPSASGVSVSATVSNRNDAAEGRAEGRRQRRDRRRVGDAAAVPDGIGDLARHGTPARPCRDPGASSSGVRPEIPGRSSVVTLSRLPQAAQPPGRPGSRRSRRPRRNASQVMRLPPAGWTSISPGDRRRRQDRDRRTCPPRRPPGRTRARRPHDEPTDRRLDEGAGPWLIGPDLAFELDRRPRGSSRPSSRRSVRVSVAPSIGWRVADDLAADPRSEARGRASTSATISRRASRIGAVSVPSSGTRVLGDDRAGVEARVHPHQRDAGLGVAREDRRRDRGRAAMPRQQRRVQVQRTVPQLEQRRRDDLAVVGEDQELGLEGAGSRRWTPGSRRRSGVEDGRHGELVGGPGR